ncbi:MAG TPA: hypothetical protein VEH05_09345 [Streptosporangiaceae bacterium]|nr:hypothetical protein [Streptosporangiaceae bacterium]
MSDAVSDWWAQAVALAGQDPPGDLATAVAEELIALWSDLAQAVLRAGEAGLTECQGLVVRIVMLSRLTAATPPAWVPDLLVRSGIYAGVVTCAGLTLAPSAQPEAGSCSAQPMADSSSAGRTAALSAMSLSNQAR